MNKNFVLIDALPDASSIFRQSYRSVDEIKGACLVSLDTNVLLAPYKLGASSFAEITKIYRSLEEGKRLVLPGHVAREYARQRTVELSNLVKALRDHSSRAASPLLGAVPFLEADKHFKAAKEASDEVGKSIKEARKLLDKVLVGLSNPIKGDPVLATYAGIFSSCIEDYKIDDRELFEQDCEYRFANGVPPGYHDSSKENNAIGDLIIWHTVMSAAKSRKMDMIFVTGDDKSDWWVRHDKSPFQPRYELVDEFARVTEGQTIHIVPLHRFVEIFGAGREVIQETAKVEREVATGRAAVERAMAMRRSNRRQELMAELSSLRERLEQLSRFSHSNARSPRFDKVALDIADQISDTKRRISQVEYILFSEGPDYSRAPLDE